jgi:cytochrome c-type biogenesis protein CcmE
MKPMRLKVVIVSVILIGAMTFLALAGAKQGWVYHLTVDQYLTDAQYHSQRVRLCGTVDEEGFASNSSALNANFQLKGETKRVNVVYHGVIPPLFQAGHDVVVEGRLNTQGVFQADVMMTKCASKYESDGKGHMKKTADDGRAS